MPARAAISDRWRPPVALPVVAALFAALALAGCDGEPDNADASPPTTAPSSSAPASPQPSPTAAPSVSIAADVATGLEVPWGIAALPDGGALVAERPTGQIVRVSADGEITALGVVPGVRAEGEGGLLGLAVAAAAPQTVYAYLTTSADNRIVRIEWTERGLGRPQPVLTGIPSGAIHNGGRLAIGPDGLLWAGTGDAGDAESAQDRGSLAGKILRIGTDGSVPADNPFGSPIWSYGHRNVQGLAFDGSGRLWASEFGSQLYDELNLVERGSNYGWPLAEGDDRGRDDLVDPQVTWPTDEASPSGIAILDDVVYVAALRGQRLWQVPLTDDGAGEPVAWLEGALGRLRTVAVMSDGAIWLATSNRDGRGDPRPTDDRIVRLSLGAASN
jgi:glucose/arabinose dehydrogenase